MWRNLYVPFFDKSDNYGMGSLGSKGDATTLSSNVNAGTIHLIGIGGIGMSGIAEVLLNLGYKVSGSDLKESAITKRLASMGAEIYYEHKKENVIKSDAVVFSAAVPFTNPEIREAKRLKIPVIPRAEMLNELVRMKRGIGISGTHGKTTTTGMISLILKEGGFDPTMLVGGVLDAMGSNAHLGHGKYLVFEACEAYNSIDYFLPEISVLLNIDKDHMECYNNFDELKTTFSRFLNKVPFYSFCVVNIDDANIKDIMPFLTKRVVTFGFSQEADVRGANIEYHGVKTSFDVIYAGKNLGSFTLNIPGEHNVLNALAAIATALYVGVNTDDIKSALLKFKNSERRFQILLETDSLSVVDDYAHHPKEIEATLAASRQYMEGRKLKRLIAVFQPHLFSRTKLHYEDFAKSLVLADKVYLTSIYPAREKPIPGVSAHLIYDLLKENEGYDVVYIEQLDDLEKEIVKDSKNGDLVITLGAGNITNSAHRIAELVKSRF